MIGRRVRLVAGLAATCLVLVCLPRPVRVSRALPSGSQDTAECPVERARSLKRRMLRAQGDERTGLRALAVEAYTRVYRAASNHPAERAEAAFRAGELARAGGDVLRARGAFEHAAGYRTGAFACRAQLELGHLARRAGELQKAAQQYEMLLLGPCDEPYVRDETLFWLARVRRDAGRTPAAVSLLQRLEARSAEGSLRDRARRELARLSTQSPCEQR